MNKALMISIRPEHAYNILTGKKTLELRTWIPKGYVGWVYVYVCKTIRNYKMSYYYQPKNQEKIYRLHGNIPFRFWFDDYIAYKYYEDDSTYFAKRPQDFRYNADEVLKRLCLSRDEFKAYGKGKDLYAWHIKQLEIFDKPMELKNFHKLSVGKETSAYIRLDKAPQSWQYVYVKGESK